MTHKMKIKEWNKICDEREREREIEWDKSTRKLYTKINIFPERFKKFYAVNVVLIRIT